MTNLSGGDLDFVAILHAVLSEKQLRMVVMSLPLTVSDVEGEISHIGVAENETLVFIKLNTWRQKLAKIHAKIQDLVPSLRKIMFTDLESGKNFINFHQMK